MTQGEVGRKPRGARARPEPHGKARCSNQTCRLLFPIPQTGTLRLRGGRNWLQHVVTTVEVNDQTPLGSLGTTTGCALLNYGISLLLKVGGGGGRCPYHQSPESGAGQQTWKTGCREGYATSQLSTSSRSQGPL